MCGGSFGGALGTGRMCLAQNALLMATVVAATHRAVAAAPVAQAPGHSWVAAFGNSQRSSSLAVASGSWRSVGGEPLWRTKVVNAEGSSGAWTMLADDSSVFVVSRSAATVVALNTSTGVVMWQTAASVGFTADATLFPGFCLYVACTDGVRALAVTSGALVWYTTITGVWSAGLTLQFGAGMVWVLAKTGSAVTLYGLDASNGRMERSLSLGSEPACLQATLSPRGGILAVLRPGNGQLLGINGRGENVWMRTTSSARCPVAVVMPTTQQEVFVTEYGNVVTLVNVEGTVVSTHSFMAGFLQAGSFAVTPQGVLVFCALSTSAWLYVAAWSLPHNQLLWQTEMPGCSLQAPPTIGADGTVYVTSLGQDIGRPMLAALDGVTGVLLWRQLASIDYSFATSAVILRSGQLFTLMSSQSLAQTFVWAHPAGPGPSVTPSPSATASPNPTRPRPWPTLVALTSSFTPLWQKVTGATIASLMLTACAVAAFLCRTRRWRCRRAVPISDRRRIDDIAGAVQMTALHPAADEWR